MDKGFTREVEMKELTLGANLPALAETLDFLKPPEMQCVNCWHRWKPKQHFRDTPKCPVCQSTWLITAESINMALRKEHVHKLPLLSPGLTSAGPPANRGARSRIG